MKPHLGIQCLLPYVFNDIYPFLHIRTMVNVTSNILLSCWCITKEPLFDQVDAALFANVIRSRLGMLAAGHQV